MKTFLSSIATENMMTLACFVIIKKGNNNNNFKKYLKNSGKQAVLKFQGKIFNYCSKVTSLFVFLLVSLELWFMINHGSRYPKF